MWQADKRLPDTKWLPANDNNCSMVQMWGMAFYYSLRTYIVRIESMELGLIVLEALDSFSSSQQSSSHFHASSPCLKLLILVQTLPVPPSRYALCLFCPPPGSNTPHASPASKFTLLFMSQISSSVDGLRPWSSEKKPCQGP